MMADRHTPFMFYVYMMTNKNNTVIYTGHTDDLAKRVFEHQNHQHKGFTDRYNCEKLVWYEAHENRDDAKERERRIKRWARSWKVTLVQEMNPEWRDLGIVFLG
ncbi:MAG: GIY-YIG nuclease family protein [Pseudomonadota bacterium]